MSATQVNGVDELHDGSPAHPFVTAVLIARDAHQPWLDATVTAVCAQTRRPDRLVVVGAGAQAIAQGARTAGMTADAVTTVDDIDAAHDVLVEQIAPGDVVLFKSSRDSGLRMLGDRLVEESGTPAFPVTEVTS